ncbi:TadE/TadG family type IV pilus assembly protein [Paenisporosarcina cavernae]|uniref:Pilus assembly protein n=1 Tax=Paenisporosarcina cavernae TaxID=2320858 RepID=A0A385YPV5_9BACL|nr:TadE/TadG family type IV pilus assembly protein [Paenisporosarcina cavernae]AYC28636.1 pilus assembly protein [Paenisporosarcina cavernae]
MIREEKGQSLVEFALVIPVFLLFILFIVDLGRVAYTYSTLHFTAQETVRIGSFGHSDAEMATYAQDHFSAGDGSDLTVSISPSEAVRESGDYITLTLSYPFEPVMPLAEAVLNGPLTIQVESTIRME